MGGYCKPGLPEYLFTTSRSAVESIKLRYTNKFESWVIVAFTETVGTHICNFYQPPLLDQDQ